MGLKSGDKGRDNRKRKRKLARRVDMRALRKAAGEKVPDKKAPEAAT